jgi:hypothetical protein
VTLKVTSILKNSIILPNKVYKIIIHSLLCIENYYQLNLLTYRSLNLHYKIDALIATSSDNPHLEIQTIDEAPILNYLSIVNPTQIINLVKPKNNSKKKSRKKKVMMVANQNNTKDKDQIPVIIESMKY